MKTLKSEVKSISITDSVFCNMCGNEVETGEHGYLDTYISVEKQWGYGSPCDGELHSFELCAECYKKIISQFKISPLQSL